MKFSLKLFVLFFCFLLACSRTPTTNPPPGGGGGTGSGSSGSGTTVTVDNLGALTTAVANATPGTEIIVAPGTYDLGGSSLNISAAGTANNRIIVRAQNPNTVTFQTSGATQGFHITGPYWTFQDLNFQVNGGSFHAYKLEQNGHDIIIHGGRMELSPTAESGVKGAYDPNSFTQPDNVVIEETEIFFTSPCTYDFAEGIDAVGVRNWTIRNNTIHDIRRAASGGIAFGIVLKGNSQDSVIENNLLYDNFIGISVGGTTSSRFFRDGDQTFEHRGGFVRNNVLLDSDDVAIYLENATEARVYNNTTYNSYTTCPGGCSAIDHRVNGRSDPQNYTATFTNNLLDKPINNRDGAVSTQSNNLVFTTLPSFTPNQFVNVATRNLHVVRNSDLDNAIRDQGLLLTDVLRDQGNIIRPQGSGFDIGAYEHSQIDLARETGHGLPGFYLGQIGVADFDGDGLNDLAILGSWGPQFNPPDANGDVTQTCITRIRLFENISQTGGAIRFRQRTELQDPAGCRAGVLAIGDFDNNGRQDIAYQFHGGNTRVPVGAFLNEGSWNFEPTAPLPESLEAGSTSLGLVAADVDQDGRDDLIISTSETSTGDNNGGLWYRFSGNQWQARQQDFNHYISYGGTITAGDLNGDSYPEIAIGGNSGQVLGNQDCRFNLQYGHVFRNTGAGNPRFHPDAFYALRVDEADSFACRGSDNASYKIIDVDDDGSNDIIVAGSAPGFERRTRPDYGNSHYSLSVLFNNGNGTSYEPWQNTQIDLGPNNGNSTNSGVGNVEVPNIAAGDLTGEGQLEIFVQGHRRNNEGRTATYDPTPAPTIPSSAYYIFQTILLRNDGNRQLTQLDLGFPNVGEGGQAIADFNNDGKQDLVFGGALIPWHTNGQNGTDENTSSTLITEVYRNVGS